MPSSVGPYQTRGSNLVFNYDVGDVVNSYIGEPTTNLANFDIASIYVNTDTPGNLTTTTNSSEATYQRRLSRKMVVGSGFWNAYIYGYNTGVSSTVFAVSYKIKIADGSHPSTIVGGGYIYGSAGSFYPAPTFSYLSDGWYLATMLYAGSSMILNSITGMYGSGGPKTFYIVDYQAETKTHATPFAGVAGTRSNTQGLLDISGYSNTLTLNTSYDANAMMYFDGTDDNINVPNSSLLQIADNVTVEAIIKVNSSNIGSVKVIANKYFNTGWELILDTSGNFVLGGRNGDGTYYSSNSNTVIADNTYHHVVGIKSGFLWQTYVDRVLKSTVTANNVGGLSNSTDMQIGREGNSYYTSMYLPVFKVYNRALSQSEITTNYNSYKKRFNLS